MEPLTTAELRALHALARYETATEAAKAAGLSPQTLRNQAAMAFKKLGVHGRVEAFRKIGWLRPPRFMPSATDVDPYATEGFRANGTESDPTRPTAAEVISLHLGEELTERHSRRARRSAGIDHLIR